MMIVAYVVLVVLYLMMVDLLLFPNEYKQCKYEKMAQDIEDGE